MQRNKKDHKKQTQHVPSHHISEKILFSFIYINIIDIKQLYK